MKLLTPRQISLIVNSISRVIHTGDIDNLTKSAYNYLNLCSGFIAHYNLHGFRHHYENVDDLVYDLQCNAGMNQWTNFRPGDRDYEYMMQKRDVYNEIIRVVEAY
jgi:hypothetical protein